MTYSIITLISKCLTYISMYLHRVRSSIWFSVVSLIIAMISIQCGAVLAKSLFIKIGVSGVIALRLGFGTLILILIFRPWRLRIEKNQYVPLLMYGIALGAMNYSFYLSIRTVPLGIAVALEFCGPLLLALFGSRRFIDFIWITLTVLGLWLLLPINNTMSEININDIILAIIAGGFWVIYIITGSLIGTGGLAIVAIGSSISTILFLPIVFILANNYLFNISIIPIGVILAAVSSALPYSLEMIALTRLPSNVFSTLMSLEPGIAALSGMFFFNEILSIIQWIGLIAIISASIGSAITTQRKPYI